MLDRAGLTRHVQRHATGQQQYQRVVFTVAGPGFSLDRVPIVFRRTKDGWVTVRSARTTELLERHDDLAANVEAHVLLLNSVGAATDVPVFSRRPPFAAHDAAPQESSLPA